MRVVTAAAMAVTTILGLSAQTASHPATATVPVARGWGTNDDGAIGAGSTAANLPVPTAVKIPAGVTITSIRAGCDGSVALTKTGTVLAWGVNSQGEVGDGTMKVRQKPVNVKLPKGTKITAVRAGCDDSIALTKTGTVLAWGLGVDGELGNGTFKNSDVPVQVHLPKGTKVKAITAGCSHNLALTTAGQLYAWGANSAGQLGDGTHKNRKNPVLVKLPAGVIATGIAAGCSHTLAVTNQGLFAWGDNGSGQLGTGNFHSHDVPDLVPLLFRGLGPGTITSIFAGCAHSLALFSKGGVAAWGDDADGQLGDGGANPSPKPIFVTFGAGVSIKAISAGCDDSYALTTSGQVLAWGRDTEGELGDAGSSNQSTPVEVSNLTTVTPTALGGGPGALHAFVIAQNHP
jgi:alpha-tubulin suppressor-like RCC1 family protein